MGADYYILSKRGYHYIPAQGCLVEFEDILVNCCQGTLVTPTFPDKFIDFPQSNKTSKKGGSIKQVLIIVCLTVWDCKLLDHIPKWRTRFDVVCVYIFDALLDLKTIKSWKCHNFRQLIKSLDYIFIPMTGSLKEFEEIFQVPVAMIPMACDVMKFGSFNTERYIDLIGYGRQKQEHSDIFEQAYNSPQSKRIYYYTNHMQIKKINDFYGHRRLFWKLLNNSHIALAYDVLTTENLLRKFSFSFSFVGQRWYECLAGGCMIVGKRPKCPEADQLLDWKDATIDLPDDQAELVPFIESLLTDKQRLYSSHHRNYLYALARHDWRYRIVEMLSYLGLEQPSSLQQALSDLQQKYDTTKKLLKAD